MSEFPWELLAVLLCPCCGSRFEASLKLAVSSNGMSDGILRCDCYGCSGLLGFNPLYRLDKAPDGLVASAAWPSDSLRRECTGTPLLLRESVHVDSHTLQEIIAARTGGPLTGAVRELLRSFVVVPVPECYPGGNRLARWAS